MMTAQGNYPDINLIVKNWKRVCEFSGTTG